MSMYVVPVKGILEWNGRIYGAGEGVPGYVPPAPKVEQKPEPKAERKGRRSSRSEPAELTNSAVAEDVTE
jgi:hypothetical protein